MIKNLDKSNIRPASVDLRLAKIFRLSKVKCVDLAKNILPKSQELKLPHVLKPNEYLLANTIEEVSQKNKKYLGILSARSRAFRIGLSIQTNIFGPYYEGPFVFGIKNISNNPIRLSKGLSLVQVAFLEIKGQTVPVKHDFQGGKIL